MSVNEHMINQVLLRVGLRPSRGFARTGSCNVVTSASGYRLETSTRLVRVRFEAGSDCHPGRTAEMRRVYLGKVKLVLAAAFGEHRVAWGGGDVPHLMVKSAE